MMKESSESSEQRTLQDYYKRAEGNLEEFLKSVAGKFFSDNSKIYKIDNISERGNFGVILEITIVDNNCQPLEGEFYPFPLLNHLEDREYYPK